MTRKRPLLALSLLVLGCGKGSGGNPDAAVAPPDLAPPPAICKTPAGVPPQPWFTEVTGEVGLAPTPKLTPLATTLQAADLDGDGYPDLLASAPADARETDKRSRFLFMNRPAPDDATGKRRVWVDATKDSGILSTRDGKGGFAMGVANFGDVDNDGDLDVVASPAGPNIDNGQVLLNDGTAHFTLAPKSEIDDKVGGFGPSTSILFDYDRDGLLDFMPGTFNYPPPNGSPPLLFRGKGGGKFVESTEAAGISIDQGDVRLGTEYPSMYGITSCDIDLDGDQDLLFADYGRAFNRVYRNDAGKFTEIGKSLGVWADDRLDFSDDQSYRCYCYNRPGTCKPQPPDPAPNYCTGFGGKDGRGWFPGNSDQPYRLAGNTFTITCGDLDDDGDMDLMTAEIRHGDVGTASDPSELLINNSPPGGPLKKFDRPGNKVTGIDRVETGIYWNEGDFMPVFADFDFDGRKDIFLSSADYPGNHGWAWRQKPDGKFEDITKTAGIGQKEAKGVTFIDFDRDGDLDVLIGTSTFRGGAPTAALRAYRNNVGQDQNWVQVRLIGKGAGGANRAAIGAAVRVTAGGRTQLQEVSGGYGLSTTQNDVVLSFGLGAACAIDKLEVRWPNAAGETTTYTGVRANYRVQISEGDANVAYVLP